MSITNFHLNLLSVFIPIQVLARRTLKKLKLSLLKQIIVFYLYKKVFIIYFYLDNFCLYYLYL